MITHDFQVPVRSPDDILELFVWIPLRPNHHKVVHWFSSGFVSRNDLHVPEPNGRFGRESAFPLPENSTGLHRYPTTMLLLCIYVYILSSQIFFWFQLTFLFLALISVPWMLLPKPFILKKQHEAVSPFPRQFSYKAFQTELI